MNTLKRLFDWLFREDDEPYVDVYTQTNGRKAVNISRAQVRGKPCAVCGSNCGQCGNS